MTSSNKRHHSATGIYDLSDTKKTKNVDNWKINNNERPIYNSHDRQNKYLTNTREINKKLTENSTSKLDVNKRIMAISRLLTSTKSSNQNKDFDRYAKDDKKDNNTSVASQASTGSVVKDAYSRGNQPDVVSERDCPYKCTECTSSFMMAPQLSDHLWKIHNIIRHASLLKPNSSRDLKLQEDVDNDDDDDDD